MKGAITIANGKGGRLFLCLTILVGRAIDGSRSGRSSGSAAGKLKR
jgi:hypothetical protein